MILINLLPPELRRKRASSGTKLNPMILGAAAGLVLCLLSGLLYWHVHSKIKVAEDRLADLDVELSTKQAQAAAINEMQGKIAEFESLRDTLVNLLVRKVYWARTLDDFVNYLVGPWSVEGFTARCLSLTVDPSGSGKGDSVVYKFRWRVKIVGDDENRIGEYIRSFFHTTEDGSFWKTYNFPGKPEDDYRGDTPQIVKEFRKVAVDLQMDWDRTKLITKPGKR